MLTFDPVLLSRIQFALTLSFHILFPSLTIGLSIYIVIWELAWLKTKNVVYLELCRFWSKIFALGFGLGVVSGIVLSYEFGTNFSRFSEMTGNVLGPLMSYEVLTAFFLEAGFLGIMLFGWKRVTPLLHATATLIVAIGATLSAFWILSANSWMQTPAGFAQKDGIFYVTNWWQVIFNPSFPYRFLHMVIASYLAVTFLLAGVSAYHLYINKYVESAKKTFSLTMAIAFFLAPLQLLLGDLHGLNTVQYQPLKVAAIEARWETERGAPLTLIGVPDMQLEKNRYAVDIPKLGSLILRHQMDGEIVGLKSVPKEDRPYVPVVFYAFRIMVGIGIIFIFFAFIGQYLRYKEVLFTQKQFLKYCQWISPLGFIAILAGWFTTEVGRQPWAVYGLLRTKDVASILKPEIILTSLSAFIILYLILISLFLFYFIRLIKNGPEQINFSDQSHRLTSWFEDKK